MKLQQKSLKTPETHEYSSAAAPTCKMCSGYEQLLEVPIAQVPHPHTFKARHRKKSPRLEKSVQWKSENFPSLCSLLLRVLVNGGDKQISLKFNNKWNRERELHTNLPLYAFFLLRLFVLRLISLPLLIFTVNRDCRAAWERNGNIIECSLVTFHNGRFTNVNS